jgi:hypothetical protein
MGFEQPAYNSSFNGTGQLEGQPAGSNPWFRTTGVHLGDAFVQGSVVRSGAQAVTVERDGFSDDRWGVVLAEMESPELISIEWDMRVESSNAPAGAFGPFFGVEAYDDDGASLGLLGSLGVDAATGDVLYQLEDSGFLTETGTIVDFGVWHSYRIELNFENVEYQVFIDETLLASTGFVDRVNGLDELSDADIAAIAAAGDSVSQSLFGTAYIDNFVIAHRSLSTIPGDFDLDGSVNLQDFEALKSNFGVVSGATLAMGDANADGTVDLEDFEILKSHFGGTAESVPEPSAFLLLACAGPLLFLVRTSPRAINQYKFPA